MQYRLALLAENKVISEVSYQASLKAAALLSAQLKVSMENEQFQMLMTHLSRAADRVLTGEPVSDGLDEEIWQEILQSDEFSTLNALNQKVLAIYCIDSAPEMENQFLLSNLFAMYHATINAN